jgi:hypothetical protein
MTERKYETYQNGEIRLCTYTILEDENIKWHWDLQEVAKIRNAYNKGLNFVEIAEECDRSIDDVFLVLYDQARKGNVKNLDVRGVL